MGSVIRTFFGAACGVAVTIVAVATWVGAAPTSAPATRPTAGADASGEARNRAEQAASAGGVEALDRMLVDKNAVVRAAAVAAFQSVPGDSPIEKVYPFLDPKKEPDAQVRASAAKVLGAVPAWENVDPLVAALADPDLTTRREAQVGLEQILGITLNAKGRPGYDPERPETAATTQDRLHQWLAKPEVHDHLVKYWTFKRRDRANKAHAGESPTTKPTRD